MEEPRTCPLCEGEGSVLVFGATLIDPAAYDVCSLCDGEGEVDEKAWERGQRILAAGER